MVAIAEGDISPRTVEGVVLLWYLFEKCERGECLTGVAATYLYCEGVLGRSISIRSYTDLTRSARLFLRERKNL